MAIPNCTNITLRAKEFTIHSKTLIINQYSTSVVNISEYEKISESVRVCFPFSENFSRCPKWKFNPDELYFNPSDKSVTYTEANLSYALGNYFTSTNNSTWVCVPESCLPTPFNIDAFFVSLWLISIIGLTLSIFMYTPQTRNRHHLKPALFHMICLLGTYVSLIVYQTSSSYKNIWANYITYLNIFLTLGGYTWLNVMGHDAWRQFHSKRLFTHTPISTRDFVYRSVYGWGVPTLLTLCIAVPESLGCFKQTQRVERVGIKDDLLHTVVIIGGLSTSLGVNIVFFILIVLNLRQLRRDLKLVNSCVQDIRFNIRMHIKLIIIMGLTFICVIVAVISGPSNEIYFSLFDAIVSLQGFFLFLIYGWTPTMKKARLLCKTSV